MGLLVVVFAFTVYYNFSNSAFTSSVDVHYFSWFSCVAVYTFQFRCDILLAATDFNYILSKLCVFYVHQSVHLGKQKSFNYIRFKSVNFLTILKFVIKVVHFTSYKTLHIGPLFFFFSKKINSRTHCWIFIDIETIFYKCFLQRRHKM